MAGGVGHLKNESAGRARWSSVRPEPFGDWEATFVRAKRGQNASWASIAQMLGRSEPDVRRAFDAEWRG